MEGQYEAHRVLCQGCSAVHLADDVSPRKAAETVYVMDRSPDGYVPDPRMMPRA